MKLFIMMVALCICGCSCEKLKEEVESPEGQALEKVTEEALEGLIKAETGVDVSIIHPEEVKK
jgi:hypothetical protein